MKWAKCVLCVTVIAAQMTVAGCSSGNRVSAETDKYNVKTDYQYQYFTYDNKYRMNATEDEDGNLYYMNGFYIYKYNATDGTNKPLCNRQNCLHDKETDRAHMKECNAYFPYYGVDSYNDADIAYEDGFVYISFDNSGADESDHSSYRSIIRISVDGSIRENVHNFKDESIMTDICHRGVYYYTSVIYNKDNKETMSVKAYSLDGKSKEKTLYTIPEKINGEKVLPLAITDYMAYGNYLYFFVMASIGSDTQYEKEFCVNISTGKTNEITAYKKQKESYVRQIMFFNNRLYFYMIDADRGEEDYDCSIYESDLDGSNVKKTSLTVQKFSNMYSDGDYLYISDDGRFYNNDLDAHEHVSPDAAEYKIYDKELNLIDTYTEDKKDNMDPVTGPAAWYYVPVGVGKYSYFVKRDFESGTAELCGGNKDTVGSLNGKVFPRKKLATVEQSSAVKQYIEEGNVHPNSIYLYVE